MALTKVAITRPVFILMLMLAAFMIGLISYNGMRKELNPEVNFGVVTVSTVYSGAGPEEINNLISRKVEEAVSGVAGVREITSTSIEGVSTVVIQLELNVDTNVALNDVRSKVDAITNNLPKDADKPQVSKFDNSAQPVLYLSVTSSTQNSRELRTLIDDKIKDRFGQIPGVASADVTGGDVREIQVQIKKDKLLAYGLGITDVQRAIASATLNAPSGRLISGDQEYSVRVLGEFKNTADIQNMVFTVSDPKSFGAKAKTVHLSDVATIVDTSVERRSYSRLNGSDNIVLAVQKTRDGNAVEITEAADALIKGVPSYDLIKNDPKKLSDPKRVRGLEEEYANYGLKIIKTTETAKQIKESLADLNFSLFFGIFLVALIVYIFLHNFRGTLIVAIAIPVCIFATFIAMKGLGFTVNNLSMLALSLAIGVMVDDAIVVLENISRHLRMGEEPAEAALNGRAEIGLAAIAITMADVVVFLPVGFMGGIVGQFFKPLALGYVVAVLFSLYVSFTVTPMLASRWYRKGEDLEHVTGRFAVWFEKVFHKFEHVYERALEWALNHRWFVFITGNLALVATMMFIAGGFNPKPLEAMQIGKGPFIVACLVGLIVFVVNIFRGYVKPQFILYGALFGLIFPAAAFLGGSFRAWKGESVFKFSFLPASDSGTVNISIELPAGSALTETQKFVERLEKVAMAHPDTKYVLSNVGSQSGGSFGGGNAGSNYGQITVTLNDKASPTDSLSKNHPEKLRYRSAEAVAGDILVSIGSVAGAKIKVSAQDSFGFGSAIQMSFVSDNREILAQTTEKVLRGLQAGAVKGVINPDLSSKPGKPELQAIPDRLALADAGLTVQDVGSAMRTLYQGNDDSKLRVLGKEYGIRVMMDRTDRDNPNIVQEVPITFKQGNPVYLGAVANLQQAPALDKVERRNRIEEIRVTADLLPGYAAGSAQQEITDWMNREKLIPGEVSFRPLGQADSQAREGAYLFSALGIGLVLVYMVLASLFDNLLYPFIIQLSQPQAIVGALLALVLTDKALNLVGFIGIIVLVGLVGKNAILLVDYTNTLRGRGVNRHDALVKAGPTRLRPIMMTTLALILGTLPVALAIGRGSEFRETIGITIIGGMLLSTFLTLLVIPCSYTIFDDISRSVGRTLKRARGLDTSVEDEFKVMSSGG